MTRLHALTTVLKTPRRIAIGAMLVAGMVSTGCTTNYLTNSTEGTYGVPLTERTIPQRLLDRSIEHTAKINIYGLQENLQANSRLGIHSFYSEVLLTGEIPTQALKEQAEKVVSSMPDVRRVYNELNVGVAKGYSSTVQDGYITSKLLAKSMANSGVKTSQLKAVTDNGVVYIMGRMTPTQQSHLIDIANSTAGVTELVLLTTLVNQMGLPIINEDIMFESNVTEPASTQAPLATPVVRSVAPTNLANSNLTNNDAPASPNQSPEAVSPLPNSGPNQGVNQESPSPYIDLYEDQ
ncbi:BON domain-containing protein [Psychrobacter fulvigenes]|uniref:BON domain-containing protein n=1 Tax=Psychrobacter fulvigenes TaxID=533323 RepID=UPI00191A01B8|nr:BON domain-containing protein [Psychrobacter fulvigenes]